jgi:hypothetical protein
MSRKISWSERALNPPHLWASIFPSFDAVPGPRDMPREAGQRESSPMLLLLAGGSSTVVKFRFGIVLSERKD